MTASYSAFFERITGNRALPYQVRLRFAEHPLRILSVPTGLGKTAAVLVDWLHRTVVSPDKTPTRLVWCLPGRALTDQISRIVRDCIERADLATQIRVCKLMGGSTDNDLTLRPDERAVLVGTQDLLISRALNRGYARRPFRWPIDFALLNNDCYWVFDEVQLLGDGLASSAQLAAFRKTFGVFGEVPCCWISATFDSQWLDTVDFARMRSSAHVIELEKRDYSGEDADGSARETVRRRLYAPKHLASAPPECRLPIGCAEFVASNHQKGSLTLVIANTVLRAREIWQAVQKASSAPCVLLHSRFRAGDRALQMAQVDAPLSPEGRIIISTQVVEAGIDIDATLMVTDVAPYASLVQRFGRVNRYGLRDEASIFVVDRPLSTRQAALASPGELSKGELEAIAIPYTPEEIAEASRKIETLRSASPADLPRIEQPAPWRFVLRKADLLDLFDTTPDLAGNEMDVSRFVRSGEDQNVYVAWRDWYQTSENNSPPDDMPELREDELCPVPINDFRGFLRKNRAWSWQAIAGSRSGQWRQRRAGGGDLFPGLVVVLHCAAGGYTEATGWWPDSKKPVSPVPEPASDGEEGYSGDRGSFRSYRQTLRDHTERVCQEMDSLIEAVHGFGVAVFATELRMAARKHDWGKAHPVMQSTLLNLPLNGLNASPELLLAKQEKSKAARAHSVPFFRHELASALAMMGEGESNLAAYLVAAHHGRVRMSIRSMPGERDDGRMRTRGISDGDTLLACDLGDLDRAAGKVTLQWMVLGRADDRTQSWSERMAALLDEMGPFKLAYLEMILRAADERASEIPEVG
jgi:CRISPR-associated endonuclease/helicase Cas3